MTTHLHTRALIAGAASALLAAGLIAGCTSKSGSSTGAEASMTSMALPANSAPPATFLTGDTPGASPSPGSSQGASTSGGGAAVSAQPAVTTGVSMTGFGNPLPGMPP